MDHWKKEDVDQIKMQVELIQGNINIWKEETDTDSEEES